LSGKLGLLASLLIDGFVNTLFVGAAAATCFGFPICLFLLGLAATEVAARASNNIESYLDSLKSSPRAKRKHVLPEEITNAESWTFSQTFESLSKTSKKYKRLRSFATKFDFLRKMGARGSRIFDYSLRLARIADDYIYSSGKVNFFSEWIY